MAVKQYTVNNYLNYKYGTPTTKPDPANDNAIAKSGYNNLVNNLNNKKTTTTVSTNNSGGSSSDSGSGSSGSSSTSSNSDYQSTLAQMYAQQQAQAQAAYNQQRAQAQAAYNSGMNRLNEAWNAKTGALKNNLNSTLSNLGRQYDSSKNEVTNDANKSLREAYVNHMLNRKNINQNLSARGVGGGAAESTMANMYNAYGNSRNDINTTLNDNLTSLENMYQSNIANAQQQYNSAYADAMSQYLNSQAQMEQNLANNIIGSYGDLISSMGSLDTSYANALNKLLAKQQDYEYTPAVNTLGVENANVTQQTNAGTVTDWAKYQAMMDNMYQNGATDENVAVYLDRLGVNPIMALNLINNRNTSHPFV